MYTDYDAYNDFKDEANSILDYVYGWNDHESKDARLSIRDYKAGKCSKDDAEFAVLLYEREVVEDYQHAYNRLIEDSLKFNDDAMRYSCSIMLMAVKKAVDILIDHLHTMQEDLA